MGDVTEDRPRGGEHVVRPERDLLPWLIRADQAVAVRTRRVTAPQLTRDQRQVAGAYGPTRFLRHTQGPSFMSTPLGASAPGGQSMEKDIGHDAVPTVTLDDA
jgi:hypothetical protein